MEVLISKPGSKKPESTKITPPQNEVVFTVDQVNVNTSGFEHSSKLSVMDQEIFSQKLPPNGEV